MAKKKAAPKTKVKNKSVGHILITINDDGTYNLETTINPSPQDLTTYATVLSDMVENKINSYIIKIFSESNEPINQQIAEFLSLYLKDFKNIDQPLIPADKVFKGKR